jgi:hypothetical protein
MNALYKLCPEQDMKRPRSHRGAVVMVDVGMAERFGMDAQQSTPVFYDRPG